MVYQCINIRQVPWEVLKTEASAFGLGFQHRSTKKEELQQRSRTGTNSRKTTDLNQFYSCETSPLILIQVQFYKHPFGPFRLLYFIFETSQWNTNNQKPCDETKQRTKWWPEARVQETHKQDHNELDHKHWYSGATIWNRLIRETSFILRNGPPSCN